MNIINTIQDKKKRLIILIYRIIVRPYRLVFHVFRNYKQKPNDNFLTFNAKNKRKVEFLEVDKQIETVILTCYFTKKPDPQTGYVRLNADIKYIAPWYDSIVKQQLNGIVIHDGLEKEFIEKYQNKYVQFRKYTSGNYSIFEERWFAYYLFISKSNVKKSFCTDANDVYITANPFEYISNKDKIYIGRDNANKIKDSNWLLDELNRYEKDAIYKAPKVFKYQYLYNAGVLGGKRDLILFFISRVIDLTLKTTTSCHKDMTLLNIAIHNNFCPYIDTQIYSKSIVNVNRDINSSSKYICTGFPLNSAFKKFELNSQAYFIHK